MSNGVRKALTKNVVDVAQSLVSLNVVGDVITANLTTLTKVGEGNILKVVVGATTYVAFADESTSSIAATINTTPGIELVAGTHYVLCHSNYIIMSTNPTRKELIRI